MISFFLLFCENKVKGLCSSSVDNMKLQLIELSQNKNNLNKYKYFAMSICSDLMDLIEVLKGQVEEVEGIKNIEEMRTYLRVICIDVEKLTLI